MAAAVFTQRCCAFAPPLPCLQHDDAVKAETYDALNAVLGGKESAAGGCQASATLFTLARGTSALVGCGVGALCRLPADALAAAAWAHVRVHGGAVTIVLLPSHLLPPSADCSVLQQLFAEGHEVAAHSLSHQKVRSGAGSRLAAHAFRLHATPGRAQTVVCLVLPACKPLTTHHLAGSHLTDEWLDPGGR